MAALPWAAANGAEKAHNARQEWPVYAGTNQSKKYAPADQINRENVGRLKIVWRWESPDANILNKHPELTTWKFEATPIMVRGVLYTSTSLGQVAAIRASNGETLWVYDPQSYEAKVAPPNMGFVHRGVAFWTDGKTSRVFIGTGDAYLIALDTTTGKPILSFGQNGRVDLTQGLRRPVDRHFYGVDSPPLICRDTVIVGASILDQQKELLPPGDVRGFDARTGALRWTFHTIPVEGEYGSDTWENQSWREAGSANVWAPMSADDARGYVYLPVSTPSSDYYGARRPGPGLFGESLVCLDAVTGKRIWHFQLVHHGLWDYDPPAAPILFDARIGKRWTRAIAEVTKQGFVYVFDRISGAPIWPINEMPVPQSQVPGEHSSATQPIPTRPKAFDRQGVSLDDLIDLTPALRREAEAIVARYDHGPLFLPPSIRGALAVPGSRGGASWSGAAYDPESGILYVPSITARPDIMRLVSSTDPKFPDSYRIEIDGLDGPEGLPIMRPPWGRITAIDMHTGARVWMAPMGNGPKDHPALRSLKLGRLGWPNRGFPLVTRTLLFVAQEGPILKLAGWPKLNHFIGEFGSTEPSIQVFDKRSGRLIREIPIPANASGSPMTYVDHGKQFIVVATGGGNFPAELIALALP
jgi:quinoprotein glucose dehydrogenase